jgi:hypothetical protein
MGHQIIVQPDGQLCVFSTEVDQIVLADASPAELVEHFAELAAAEVRRSTTRKITAVLAGDARSVYAQFALTYDEAVRMHREYGGDPEMTCPDVG